MHTRSGNVGGRDADAEPTGMCSLAVPGTSVQEEPRCLHYVAAMVAPMGIVCIICAFLNFYEHHMPTGTDSMARRHEVIADIIAGQAVGSQAQLGRLLAERGIRVTQSCISRDLSVIGAVKRGRAYSVASSDISEGDRQTLATYVRGLANAGPNLAIVRTATGAAQRVALFLDRCGWPEIVATVAGDDTIFVATRNRDEQRVLLARLRHEMAPASS
ncbi:MAG: hypothetical protein F4222_01025 [Gammaproteobacteria bacterium]|nr:hypothetical protein [Gammaproteobacteria bacterium]MYF57623.1 hypothetical protein [Gammaproteobacteria bacterium]